MAVCSGVYKPRRARDSALFRLVKVHLDEFLRVYAERFARNHGPLRPVVERVLRRFLTCGLPEHGFARAYCASCRVVSHVIAARVYHVKARRQRRAFPDRSDSGYRALLSNCCPRIDKARHQSGVSRFPFPQLLLSGKRETRGSKQRSSSEKVARLNLRFLRFLTLGFSVCAPGSDAFVLA
jgi:hypothetical protein